MKLDTLKNECRSLQTIREKWRSVGWPLGRIDGENGIIECLHELRNFTLYEALSTKTANGQTIEQLIEDLEDFYRIALRAWDEFRTVFDHEHSQQHFLRWPDGTYPAKIRRLAHWDFWEMATTTRFNVRDTQTAGELIAMHFNSLPPLEKKHSVSLAIMVCISEAIEALEQIEATADNEDDQTNLNEAWEAREHAEFWLSHFETLNVASRELHYAVKKARAETERQFRAEISESNRRPGYRVAKGLTQDVIASYFKERPGQKYESLISELADKFGASVETVSRRHSEAKKKNLLS